MAIDIKKTLKDRGIGIKEIADKLGVNRQTVYYYIEQGDKNPLAQLERIADAIGIPVTELIEQPKTGITCPNCGASLSIDVRITGEKGK